MGKVDQEKKNLKNYNLLDISYQGGKTGKEELSKAWFCPPRIQGQW